MTDKLLYVDLFRGSGILPLLSEALSAYLAASQARDIVEKYAAAFDETGIAVPEPTRYKGADYSRGFELTVQRVAERVTARL